MLPNQASAGVGAVIFDKPKYDAQEIGIKVADDLDDFAKQKQANIDKKAADYQKLIADLKFDTTGVLNNDRPEIQKMSQELVDVAAKYYETQSPEYLQKVNSLKAKIENSVKASKMDDELLKVFQDPTKLEKIDNIDELLTSGATLRTAPIESDKRQEARLKMTTMPKQKTSLEILGARVKDLKSTVEARTVRDKATGGFTEEKTEVFLPDKQISDLATELLLDKEYNSKRKQDWANALEYDPATQTYGNQDLLNVYTNRAAQPQNKGKTPYQLFVEDQIKTFQATKRDRGGITFTPTQQADAQQKARQKYGNDEKVQNVAPYAETLAALFNKDKNLWTAIDNPTDQTQIKDRKLYTSNMFSGTKVGGDVIVGTAKVPNVIESWFMDANGDVYLQTTKSRVTNREDIEANKDSEDPKPVRPKLVKYSNAGELLPSILQAEFGESAADNLGAFLKMVKDKGASKGGTTYDHDMFYKANQEDEDAFIEGLSGFVKPTIDKTFPADRVVEEKVVVKPQATTPKTEAKKVEAVSSADQSALNWLNANPKAEQAEAIRKKLKAKGLIK
jgi:hypothetical protein